MRLPRFALALVLLGSVVLACEPAAPAKKEKPASAEATAAAKPAPLAEDVATAPTPETKPVAEAEAEPIPEEKAVDELVLADFTVHEWGLLRYTADQLLVSTSPPKREAVKKPRTHKKDPFDDIDENNFGTAGQGVGEGHAYGGKPLIMFHLGPAFDAATEISVSVELEGGTFREVWPTPEQGAQPEHSGSYTWTGLRATAEPCGKELAPAPDHIACSSIIPGEGPTSIEGCEAAEMASYLLPVPNCLTVGEVKTPALVYNGVFPGVPAPLTVSEGDGAALENRSAHPLGPLYLHQGEALFRIDSLAANGKVELSAATPLEGALNDALKRDLVAGGLTEGEADSFVAAWSPDVLRQPWVWQVLGFYSAEGVEAVVPMTVTPQPKGIVRVMAVTIE